MAWVRRAGGTLAVVALVVGVAALLLLGLSGPGSRMEWWSFRTGLRLMTWAAYAGIAGMVLAAIPLAMGARRLVAAIALVASLAAFLPPWLFRRTAMSVPPIHDISTDTQDPPPFVAVLDRRGEASNPAEYGGPETAEQQRQAYPDVKTVTLPEPPARAFERALSAAREQGWDIVAAVPEQGRIEATDTTPWFGFKDDVVVRVRPEGAGSRIDVRSLSRVGRSDLGKNASRIRAYLRSLGG
ncbi:MAG TPA: DUF1499 domain-containing protein [Vicinamibacteria bacterium]|nr:DUF1499 domain-containing protein [Vicinamibacteria bacterium]